MLEVEQREARAVQAAGDGLADAVVDTSHPCSVSSGGGPIPMRAESHHRPHDASHHALGRPPALEVRRARQPDVGALHGGRPVQEHPVAVDPARQYTAFLSSGDITMPMRSNVLKSSVWASETPGPSRPNAV